MKWNSCYSEKSMDAPRQSEGPRSHFQRDFDRLIFSSPFRRLQSKTQVFPLPGSKFVHNRLTHSLEVASVGRSLGSMVGNYIAQHFIDSGDEQSLNFYNNDLAYVVSSACLAHDVGNPAFGHSGEKAISNYFIDKTDAEIDGKPLKSYFEQEEWSDLINFEGNANALRQLTRKFKGKSQGGLGLTITTLASILKYPCSSSQVNKAQKHLKKYGYFKADQEAFQYIANNLGLNPDIDHKGAYKRHPFVYLVEAADDICYSIIDMEDAHRLGILSYDTVAKSFIDILDQLDNSDAISAKQNSESIEDRNESIAYLRSKVINSLVNVSYEIFVLRSEAILAGTYNDTLIGEIEQKVPALPELVKLSIEKIYRHKEVLEIEIAGYNLLYELLDLYVPAVLAQQKKPRQQTILRLLPNQFTGDIDGKSNYLRVMNILDHISSMTDVFATEHFRKLKGIEIASRQ